MTYNLEVGDRVRILRGCFKGQVGQIVSYTGYMYNIDLNGSNRQYQRQELSPVEVRSDEKESRRSSSSRHSSTSSRSSTRHSVAASSSSPSSRSTTTSTRRSHGDSLHSSRRSHGSRSSRVTPVRRSPVYVAAPVKSRRDAPEYIFSASEEEEDSFDSHYPIPDGYRVSSKFTPERVVSSPRSVTPEKVPSSRRGFETNDKVYIIKGKYVGERGRLVCYTAQRVKVRLSTTGNEVCLKMEHVIPYEREKHRKVR